MSASSMLRRLSAGVDLESREVYQEEAKLPRLRVFSARAWAAASQPKCLVLSRGVRREGSHSGRIPVPTKARRSQLGDSTFSGVLEVLGRLRRSSDVWEMRRPFLLCCYTGKQYRDRALQRFDATFYSSSQRTNAGFDVL